MYSPGACTHWEGIYFRVGIYFPDGHVLLFGMIKKNPMPQHVLTGRLCSRGKHVLLFGITKKIQAPACTHRVLALAG